MFLQQDLLSFRDNTNEKFQKMEEKMDSFMEYMTELMRHRNSSAGPEFTNFFVNVDQGKNSVHVSRKNIKEISRNPIQPEKESRRNLDYDEIHCNQNSEKEGDDKDLKPLALSFSFFFEGVEATSWVKNCEESYYEGPPIYDEELQQSD